VDRGLRDEVGGRAVSGAAPEVWRRVMTVVVDGLRADCARSELIPPALDQDQANDVMACYGAARRPP
jgi:hypothetical protein